MILKINLIFILLCCTWSVQSKFEIKSFKFYNNIVTVKPSKIITVFPTKSVKWSVNVTNLNLALNLTNNASLTISPKPSTIENNTTSKTPLNNVRVWTLATMNGYQDSKFKTTKLLYNMTTRVTPILRTKDVKSSANLTSFSNFKPNLANNTSFTISTKPVPIEFNSTSKAQLTSNTVRPSANLTFNIVKEFMLKLNSEDTTPKVKQSMNKDYKNEKSISYLWQKFKKLFNVTYIDFDDEKSHFDNFNKNVQFYYEQNRNYALGLDSWYAGINQFSDFY